MLEALGFKKRTHIGISVSERGFAELICMDKALRSIVNYAAGNINYNAAVKEIVDYNEFKETLSNMFEEAGLSPEDCCVTLSVPNVCFGVSDLEEDNSDSSYILENIEGEIEDLYVFKRNEPVVSYSIAENPLSSGHKNVVYSAMQSNAVLKILDVFDNLGADVVRIDSTYSSMLRALSFFDKFKQCTDKGERTAVLLITSSGVCLFRMNGACVFGYAETPLAVKSFSPEEIYSAITNTASENIAQFSPKNLIIINETENINSETLLQSLNFDGAVEITGRNINERESIVDISSNDNIDSSMITYMTIQAAGAACADYDEFPLNINFLPPERINGNMVEAGPYEVDFMRLLIVVIGAGVLGGLILGALAAFLINCSLTSIKNQNAAYKQQIETYNKKLKEGKGGSLSDILPVLTKILDTNKSITEIYTSLSTDIPNEIYIKKFVTNAQGGIGISGETTTSESVENFVKKLREKHGNLMLSKLSVNTKEDTSSYIPNGFTFEIKTADTDVSLEDDNDFTQTVNNAISGYNNNAAAGKTRSRAMMPPPVI